ncbi:hypothetical protein WA026_001978 [Henosepilachna vigintioctopunctata]|uniref:Uncharacterized protein n=1 Tax=Henosepilachna vigintioctopunctata TaxID=420089 RepID=A0AAW1URG5_9CUCU
MRYHHWKRTMLVLSNLFLFTTTRTHNDTMNNNNTNHITNSSRDDTSTSGYIITSDYLMENISESYNISDNLDITQKDNETVNLLHKDSQKGKLIGNAQLKSEKKKHVIGRSAKGIPENIQTKLKINSEKDSKIPTDIVNGPQQREIDDAADLGLSTMRELLDVKEPMWYRMGLFLDKDDPASRVANFGKPNRKALGLSRYAYATLEASKAVYRR